MPLSCALLSARIQLKYWKHELVFAERRHDPDRVKLCQHFIRQCKVVIEGLEYAAAHIPHEESVPPQHTNPSASRRSPTAS
jgi:hypothetical protein